MNHKTHKLIRVDQVNIGDTVCFNMPSANYRVEAIDVSPIGQIRHHHGNGTASSAYNPDEYLWVEKEQNQ